MKIRTYFTSFWLCILAALLIQGCTPHTKTDLKFAKWTAMALGSGNLTVAKEIDWNNLQIAGKDVGAFYDSMPNAQQKSDFRKAFIRGFSSSFHSRGASMHMLHDWRVVSTNHGRTVVAADAPNGIILLITISKSSGVRKISAIDLKLPNNAPNLTVPVGPAGWL